MFLKQEILKKLRDKIIGHFVPLLTYSQKLFLEDLLGWLNKYFFFSRYDHTKFVQFLIIFIILDFDVVFLKNRFLVMYLYVNSYLPFEKTFFTNSGFKWLISLMNWCWYFCNDFLLLFSVKYHSASEATLTANFWFVSQEFNLPRAKY